MSIILFGKEADSGRLPLLESANRNKFEEGSVDEFRLQATNLGDLTKIR